MRRLSVYIEISGSSEYVGDIAGESYRDACFTYSREYMDRDHARPISLSLPFREDSFSPETTHNFFEGLLPEGFSRRAVARWLKSDENDYLTILAVLGLECLGAIKIIEGNAGKDKCSYEKLTVSRVKDLAAEGASRSTQILTETHLSLAGATGKVGLYYDSANDEWYLPKGSAPSTHIVKQSHIRLSQIVLNEQLCMLAAKNMGLDVPDSFILNLGQGRDPEVLYAVKRYDRLLSGKNRIDGLPLPLRLHQEDFAQAMGLPSVDKYEREKSGYLKGMFDIIRAYCSDPIKDQLKLWKMICFNYLIGNTDCHIKNYSLLYGDDLKGLSLAPLYDCLSTRVYNLTNEMSFFIGNEIDIRKADRRSFAAASVEAGLSERMALSIFDQMSDGFEKALDDAAESLANDGFDQAVVMKEKILIHGSSDSGPDQE
ncbi:MAG: type II toxin-antitoxin system HipA family toxin [Lachnospiraceae bacterium]|nr:type II toxin-antitoxin system HipA family toxin [Lachnospiraceae bacterium]